MARTLGSRVRLVVVFSAVAGFVACGGASSQDLGAPNGDTGGSSTSSSGGSSGGSSGEGSSGASSGTSGGSSSGTSSGSSSGGSSGSSSGGSDASTDAPGDAGHDAPSCGIGDAGTFPAFESGCLSDQACAIGFHLLACCGIWEAIGIRQSAATAFDKAEQVWEQGCASCTCAESALASAQDGKIGKRTEVLVKCVFAAGALNGKCMTYLP